ncbi:alcohol dehydrogenase catalytic domain-containing protein [Frankia sp. Mgl5]|uniref:alcohol dehydrogenase catalytic domain-containing protein n=1 Tax=Frankia sp. Mgl5 TaxID=2933793 RepID=UPI00200EF724|nr:alcohol dehydrogenase catalytic domain-containing protein [Frankia sp. Mgl5]MCK9931144.1 alcohol dehydrogenase catalytic domain-containing protein [Frankia sp. Mgl5]
MVEKEDPEPGLGEVVLDVKGSGLCHSDVMEIESYGADWMLGTIMGHELAGVVSTVGPDVTEWKAGDRAAVCPTYSMECPGFHYDGGFATKHLSPAGCLVRVPDNVGWTLGAMMTDAGMTSYHALVRRGGATAGMKVGLIGLGGLGQIAARVAVLKGIDVHVAEPKKDVWPLAERLGVTHVVADVAEWENQNFDLIVDYAGFGATTAGALRAVGFNGTVVQVGLGVSEAMIPLGDMVSRKSKLLASRGGTKEDIAELYKFVAAGDLAPAVTEITFDDIPQGLADLAANKVAGRLVALI